MTNNQLARLNRKFEESFGYHEGPEGRVPRFAWKRTHELMYLVKDGTREVPPEDGRIILVVPVYRRTSWAERMGEVWVVAQWRPPIPQARWERTYGAMYPWPKNGLYYPITETSLDPGMVPDEDLTDLFISLFRRQEETPYEQLRDESERAAQADVDAPAREFADEVDEWWPAFDHLNPGSRGGHISFGGM